MKKRRPKIDWTEMRTVLWLRAGDKCEFCGKPFRGEMELHHRRLRSQGGEDTAENLAAIHPACHRRAHQFPAQAREWGWIVPSWADPAEVPIQVIRGSELPGGGKAS